MKLCIFEDTKYRKLLPLVWLRPVYYLRCGITDIAEKIRAVFPNLETVLHCREYLTDSIKETTPLPVNTFEADSYLLINGRIIPDKSLAETIPLRRINCIYRSSGTDAAAVVSPEYSHILTQYSGKPFDLHTLFPDFPVIPVDITIINHPWDIVNKNGDALISDWKRLFPQPAPSIRGKIYEGVHLLNKNNIYIAQDAVIKPGAVLDAESGPIIVESGALVMPNAVITGPAFIGKHAVINIGAQIHGTTIGEKSKIGGEVAVSIIHSHSNKQHDGFLGNSYLGQWVNLGADTVNSNLKNNYQPITAVIDGETIKTGLLFAGSIIGDHTKTGINTMLNTGTVAGICCNIFGSGFPPKYIPSFSWGGSDGFEEYKLEKALQTAQAVVSRRNMELSVVFQRLITHIYEITASERAAYGRKQ